MTKFDKIIEKYCKIKKIIPNTTSFVIKNEKDDNVSLAIRIAKEDSAEREMLRLLRKHFNDFEKIDNLVMNNLTARLHEEVPNCSYAQRQENEIVLMLKKENATFKNEKEMLNFLYFICESSYWNLFKFYMKEKKKDLELKDFEYLVKRLDKFYKLNLEKRKATANDVLNHLIEFEKYFDFRIKIYEIPSNNISSLIKELHSVYDENNN